MPDSTASFASVFALILPASALPHSPLPAAFLPPPRRLAQIVEMIHVVSLLHDDVINASALSRGVPSVPAAFGDELAQHCPLMKDVHRAVPPTGECRLVRCLLFIA
ncbi:hypothetical protein K438DRAFT_2016126 [Mycena galopus ATCC 62051]|nr:hypothetical protein K438DRAFT_2016126 [Mycena galopus ATCC 62051]